MTGIVAVVKGILSIKEEARAEIHSTIMMATSIWCSGLTLCPWKKKIILCKRYKGANYIITVNY